MQLITNLNVFQPQKHFVYFFNEPTFLVTFQNADGGGRIWQLTAVIPSSAHQVFTDKWAECLFGGVDFGT